MDVPVVLVVLLSSMSSIPIAYQVNKLNLMKEPIAIVFVGFAALTLATILPVWYIRRKYVKVDPIMYACITFSWSCVIDLLVGLEFDGYVTGFMTTYFKEGEPYLFTVHGALISYWDAFANYSMYLLMIYLFCQGKSYREVGLYWVGSLLHTMVVFLPGNLLGDYDVKWAYLLNVPYLLVPLFAGFKFLKDRPMHIKSYMHVPSILKRPKDLCFVFFFIAAILLAIFRGMIALGCDSDIIRSYLKSYEPYINDPTTYPRIQMLIYLFYFVIYYCCAIFGLLVKDQSYMTDWSIIHAGAAAQAQCAYIFGSLHSKTASRLHPPTSGIPAVWFWVVNLGLLIVPQLFVWRCKADPDMFGRTYTIDTAEPVRDFSQYETPRSTRKKVY
ncbi:hypothetical protein SNE40_011805 [Patella caerulea]|uniref:EXPERA domain-containing protein n=1 Tax=Patella caerulea TaxID=87958 RepID=A0AAN8PYJ2_PATCE